MLIIICCKFVFIRVLEKLNKIADKVSNSKTGAEKEMFSATTSWGDTYNFLSDFANGIYNTSENNDRFTKLFAVVIGILIAFPASYLTFESYYECYLEDNTTDYEITINNEDIYSCTDYKVKDNEYTKEGINLNTYETENYVLIYEDGDEIISSDTVENFKVKEIKTNRECLDFKDYVLAQFKGEI